MFNKIKDWYEEHKDDINAYTFGGMLGLVAASACLISYNQGKRVVVNGFKVLCIRNPEIMKLSKEAVTEINDILSY